MLKKTFTLFLLIILFSANVFAEENSLTHVYINNALIDIPSVMVEDDCFVSIRSVAEILNLKFGRDSTLNMTEIATDKKILQVFTDNPTVRKNGKTTYAYGTPFLHGEDTMVSVTLLQKVLGLNISYKEKPKTNDIFYLYNNGVIDVYSRYSPTHDIMVRFAKGGPNKIYDIYAIYLCPTSNGVLSTSLHGAKKLYGAAITDWHSPFVILAQENQNGDRPYSYDFTGGYHSYSNDSNGSSTATHKSIACFADGKPVSDNSSGYCSSFSINWKNDVQASNTKLINGSGRNVMEEEHTLYFDGTTWHTSVNLTPYEDITFLNIYGFQAFIKNIWDEKTQFLNGGVTYDLPSPENTDSQTVKTNELICSKGNNVLKISLNPAFGIGNKKYLANLPDAFVADYGKIYFNLVNGTTLKAKKGEKVSYRGSYTFYFKK